MVVWDFSHQQYGTSTKLPFDFGICAKKSSKDAWGFPPHHCCYQPQGWMRSMKKVMRWRYMYTYIPGTLMTSIFEPVNPPKHCLFQSKQWSFGFQVCIYIYICMYIFINIYIVYFVYASCTHVSFFLYCVGMPFGNVPVWVLSTVFLPLFRLTGNLE